MAQLLVTTEKWSNKKIKKLAVFAMKKFDVYFHLSFFVVLLCLSCWFVFWWICFYCFVYFIARISVFAKANFLCSSQILNTIGRCMFGRLPISNQYCIILYILAYPQIRSSNLIEIWLVVYLPLWTIWKSMGRMTSHILWKLKSMFETTNQRLIE